MKYLLKGKCLAWKNILDIKKAIQILRYLPEVKNDRIGIFGHSLGATQTILVGPFAKDEKYKIKAFVATCSLPTYKAMMRDEIVHSFSNYIPGIWRDGDEFDIGNILGLSSPTHFLLMVGEEDYNSPIDEVRSAFKIAKRMYENDGAGKNIELEPFEQTDHKLTEEMREKALSFFRKHLK